MTKQPWARNLWLKVRLKASELEILQKYAAKEGKSMSEVVRDWIKTLERKVK